MGIKYYCNNCGKELWQQLDQNKKETTTIAEAERSLKCCDCILKEIYCDNLQEEIDDIGNEDEEKKEAIRYKKFKESQKEYETIEHLDNRHCTVISQNNKPMCCGKELINDKCSICGDSYKDI